MSRRRTSFEHTFAVNGKVDKQTRLARTCRIEGKLNVAAQHLRNAIRLLWEGAPTCSSFYDYMQDLLACECSKEGFLKREEAAEILDSLGNVIRCERVNPLTAGTAHTLKAQDRKTAFPPLHTKFRISMPSKPFAEIGEKGKNSKKEKDQGKDEKVAVNGDEDRDFKESLTVIKMGYQLREQNLKDCEENESLFVLHEEAKEKLARSSNSLAMLYKDFLQDIDTAEEYHLAALTLYDDIRKSRDQALVGVSAHSDGSSVARESLGMQELLSSWEVFKTENDSLRKGLLQVRQAEKILKSFKPDSNEKEMDDWEFFKSKRNPLKFKMLTNKKMNS
mmetsp:Transcript_12923/g.16780  ORF Transcript_12923/g.16780 Transcript_12923/m.16780 type:complete len:334 (+) Transcript_12923:142-1143(+)|eukprot:CAMPEP_0184017460 /NCGR_PEP_ID=MMETSP0954-20121128/7548_1 /TAXON_ID=627963 /ORGANISM="Aplanochytrium sp, Strain PBS07" /LENGTH=333 /DNA_ID=CAMNT_0026298697 /DNA_START=122 /DNA_END=1123 /DNA_ORIENTATION=-